MNREPGFFARTRDMVIAFLLALLTMFAVRVALAEDANLPAMIAVDRFPAKPDCSKWESETVSESAARKLMPTVGLATSGLFQSDDWLIVRVPAGDFLTGLREPGNLAPWDASWYGPEDEGSRLYFAYVQAGSFGEGLTVFAARSGLVEIPIWRGGRRPGTDLVEKEKTR